jgi:hypothetical protein
VAAHVIRDRKVAPRIERFRVGTRGRLPQLKGAIPQIFAIFPVALA